jgi:hypothetical protein
MSTVELTDSDWGGWRGEGGGAKSYDGEKACSSVNHSLLSASLTLSHSFLHSTREYKREAKVSSYLYLPFD